MPFGVERALYRGAKRYPMTSKKGHNYYKGTGSGSMGRHTSRGGFIIDLRKVRTYVVPDLSDNPVSEEMFFGLLVKPIKYSMSTDKYLDMVRKTFDPTGTVSTKIQKSESDAEPQKHSRPVPSESSE
ncbi:14246_t:CDS:2, partial [Acaulospora morrowiae]